MTQSKVDVDDRFETQIRELRKSNEAGAKAALEGEQPKWMQPDKGDWDGDLFDIDGISDAFDREEINDKFKESIENTEDAGVDGDLVTATLQIDYLGCMERAFRSRHTMRRPRAMGHAAGRMAGHGDEKGVLAQTALEFVRGLVKQSKGK